MPEGTEVTWFERLRYAGGEPLAIMHNAVPVDVLPLTEADLEQHGLYELLRAAGHMPRMANQVVGARAATAAEARLLGDPRGAPLLTMTRTAWDAGWPGGGVRLAPLPGEPLLLRDQPHQLTTGPDGRTGRSPERSDPGPSTRSRGRQYRRWLLRCSPSSSSSSGAYGSA